MCQNFPFFLESTQPLLLGPSVKIARVYEVELG